MILKWTIRIVFSLIYSMSIRIFISTVINYKLRTIVQSKIKEGQTFKEWFLYTRFRKYIPPFMIVWYFANFIYCIVAVVIIAVWLLIAGDNEIITKVYNIFMAISMTPYCFVYVFIHGNGGRGFNSFVDRDKRYYKKKKKHPLQKKK